MKEIYILRHGETHQNLKGIVQGSGIDSDLNENGLLQAQKFYSKYHQVRFDLHIHSNLIRTRQTISHFLCPEINCLIDERIREICWGEHEGKSGEPELMEKYYRIIESWKNGKFDAKPENGESAFELGSRLQLFLNDLQDLNFNRALICTHGRTLRALLCLFKDWPLSRMEEIGHNNTGLYILREEDAKWLFIAENDLSHLE